MKTIKVKAKEGRIARESPRGPFIPHDQYVKVPDTPYVRRLLNVHGDIELEAAAPPAPPVKKRPLPVTTDAVKEE